MGLQVLAQAITAELLAADWTLIFDVRSQMLGHVSDELVADLAFRL